MNTRATPDALTAFQNKSYFPALDGIRAISVLMVMSNHLHSNYAYMRRTPGWSGVDVFCVLSGFLITTLLLREEADRGSVKLSAFYLRRFFRIVPIFLLVLLAYVPVAYFGEHGVRWQAFKSALPLYLTFMQDFVPHEAPFSFSWTLGIEEKFYLIWPVVAFVVCRKLRTRAFLGAVFFAVSAGLFLWLEATSDRAFYQARSYAALALGSLVACLLASKMAKPYSRWIARVPVIVPSLAVLLSLGLVYYDRRFVLALDASVSVFISHLLLVQSSVRGWLSKPLPVWIGKRSYSMYLIHLLILNPVRVLIHPKNLPMELVVLLIAYSLTAGASHVIYLFVEQPMRKVGKRLSANSEAKDKRSIAVAASTS